MGAPSPSMLASVPESRIPTSGTMYYMFQQTYELCIRVKVYVIIFFGFLAVRLQGCARSPCTAWDIRSSLCTCYRRTVNTCIIYQYGCTMGTSGMN